MFRFVVYFQFIWEYIIFNPYFKNAFILAFFFNLLMKYMFKICGDIDHTNDANSIKFSQSQTSPVLESSIVHANMNIGKSSTLPFRKRFHRGKHNQHNRGHNDKFQCPSHSQYSARLFSPKCSCHSCSNDTHLFLPCC